MKKQLFLLIVTLLSVVPKKVEAQDPITLIIKEAVVRVIRAVDLQIQRIQNETIWLQNAQKKVENAMAKLRLDEISGWVEKQRLLYADYFDELKKVKSVLAYYHKVRDVLALEKRIVQDYAKALRAAKNDPHLKPEEVVYINKVLEGILHQTVNSIDGFALVIQSFTLQMNDASRMEVIDRVEQQLQARHNDLRRLCLQNKQLSVSRAKDLRDIALVKALYGD